MKHIKLKKTAFVIATILALILLSALIGLAVTWLIPAGPARQGISFLAGFPLGIIILYAAMTTWDRIFGGMR